MISEVWLQDHTAISLVDMTSYLQIFTQLFHEIKSYRYELILIHCGWWSIRRFYFILSHRKTSFNYREKNEELFKQTYRRKVRFFDLFWKGGFPIRKSWYIVPYALSREPIRLPKSECSAASKQAFSRSWLAMTKNAIYSVLFSFFLATAMDKRIPNLGPQ